MNISSCEIDIMHKMLKEWCESESESESNRVSQSSHHLNESQPLHNLHFPHNRLPLKSASLAKIQCSSNFQSNRRKIANF